MNRVSAYSAQVNKFGKKMEEMLRSDFPGNPELCNELDMLLTKIQFLILNEYMKKGASE